MGPRACWKLTISPLVVHASRNRRRHAAPHDGVGALDVVIHIVVRRAVASGSKVIAAVPTPTLATADLVGAVGADLLDREGDKSETHVGRRRQEEVMAAGAIDGRVCCRVIPFPRRLEQPSKSAQVALDFDLRQ